MEGRVEIKGLTSRQDLNGACGLATDMHPVYNVDNTINRSQSRYTVLLDGGATYRVKRGNVRAERKEKGKGKGKGKKGRRGGK